MLIQLAITVLVLFIIMGGWLALQAWVRRISPGLPDDCDVLRGRWGCHGCSPTGRCGSMAEQGQSPTP